MKEIVGDIFDNMGPHDAAIFHCSLKNIADYLQLSHGSDISEVIRNMTPVTITLPPVPSPTPEINNPQVLIPVSDIDTYLWKEDHKMTAVKLDKYEENMAKAYIIRGGNSKKNY